MQNTFLFRLRCASALALWFAACFPARAATFTVNMNNFSFSPSTLRIKVGDTVSWVNQSGSHDIQSDVALFKSPPPPVQSFSFTFTSVGTVTYRCNPHVSFGMRGTIIVEATANTPPSVSITSPTGGATFTAPASITITATATDSNGTVTQVEFFVDGASIGVDTASPFSVSTTLAAGSHALTAVATDNLGAKSQPSAAVTVTASAPNVPPTVSITGPANGATFTAPASITITANATDSDGTVAQVEFFVDGASAGVDTTSPFSISTTLAAGSHTLTAVATDNQNAKSQPSSQITVTVNAPNIPPAVSLLAPLDKTLLQAPASLVLEASASDTDGTISRVDFYRELFLGGPGVRFDLLGTATSSPYRVSLANIQAGFYHVLAKATDNQGATIQSKAAVVTVYTPFSIVAITRAPTGEATLTVQGDTFMGPYTAQASADLTTWTDLPGIFGSGSNGQPQYTDTGAANATARFYRVRLDFLEDIPVLLTH
ncbi:MAG: hypothetical protein HY674_07610 [Chloroflexi bacterium]|nr:hypothetical protein [Chloroflexota bacterium]